MQANAGVKLKMYCMQNSVPSGTTQVRNAILDHLPLKCYIDVKNNTKKIYTQKTIDTTQIFYTNKDKGIHWLEWPATFISSFHSQKIVYGIWFYQLEVILQGTSSKWIKLCHFWWFNLVQMFNWSLSHKNKYLSTLHGW